MIEINVTLEIEKIKKVMERVVYLYNRYPLTISSDRHLIDMYLRVFYGLTKDHFYDNVIKILWDDRISFEAITRAGRKLRERWPERFKRDELSEWKSTEKESAYRKYYGK